MYWRKKRPPLQSGRTSGAVNAPPENSAGLKMTAAHPKFRGTKAAIPAGRSPESTFLPSRARLHPCTAGLPAGTERRRNTDLRLRRRKSAAAEGTARESRKIKFPEADRSRKANLPGNNKNPEMHKTAGAAADAEAPVFSGDTHDRKQK